MAQLAAIFPGPYSLFYSLAVIAAATSMYLAGSRRGWPSGAWAAAVLAWAVSGMAGALLPRLLLGDAVAYRTIVGAIAVSSLCLVVLARALRRDTADVLDTTAVAIPIGAALVRVGCFFAECCQGIATSLPIDLWTPR